MMNGIFCTTRKKISKRGARALARIVNFPLSTIQDLHELFEIMICKNYVFLENRTICLAVHK